MKRRRNSSEQQYRRLWWRCQGKPAMLLLVLILGLSAGLAWMVTRPSVPATPGPVERFLELGERGVLALERMAEAEERQARQ